jgi:DNA-binding MarR family transcriptional regulator
MAAARPRPLGPDEEQLWRALSRILISLPRALDEDLVRETGLSLNAYAVLMSLSEAEDHELRMSELAAATTLSPSRVTRLVDELRDRGLVVKRPCADDRRGNVTGLTDDGMARLEAAYPYHLASARRRVMDRIDAQLTGQLAGVLVDVADRLARPPRN